jgi:hypothetical protein
MNCHDLHISMSCPLNVKGPWGIYSGTFGRFTWGNRSQVNNADRVWTVACFCSLRDVSDIREVLSWYRRSSSSCVMDISEPNTSVSTAEWSMNA